MSRSWITPTMARDGGLWAPYPSPSSQPDTNTQTQIYTNTKIHNAQIHKYTQIQKYTNTKIHRTVGSLPLPLYATRGTNVAGVFYLAGGYVGEIQEHKCRLRLESVMT